jgi:hypothetical protein
MAIQPLVPFGHESSSALVGSPPQSLLVVVLVPDDVVVTVTVAVVADTVELPVMIGTEPVVWSVEVAGPVTCVDTGLVAVPVVPAASDPDPPLARA